MLAILYLQLIDRVCVCVCVCVCVMKQTNVERLNMDVGDFKRFWKLNIKFLGHYFTYFQLSASFFVIFFVDILMQLLDY